MPRKTYLSGVQNSAEFRRIRDLPIREVDPSLWDTVRTICTRTEAHGQPQASTGWTCLKCRVGALFDEQCQALLEGLDAGGLFAQLSVGSGKTLIAALIPTMLQPERSTVILTFKGLVDQVHRQLQAYRVHFNIRPDIRVISYETLSSTKEQNRRILETINPSIIIADESQAVAGDSSRSRRFKRFFEKHPEAIFCALSGSHGKRSVKECANNMHTALGIGSPLPMTWSDLTEWSEALDVSDYPRPAGALKGFVERFTNYPTTALKQEMVREGWRGRFLATPGVIASNADRVDVKLTIHEHNPPLDRKLEQAIEGVEEYWERPDGEVLMYATDKAKTVRQLRVGGFYRWNWKAIGRDTPDEEWLAARKDYRHDVREFLHSRSAVDGVDSPGLIDAAHERGDLCFPSWDFWSRVRDRPEPPAEWIWLSKTRVQWVCELSRDAGEPHVLWTDVRPFGQLVAAELQAPYFGRGKEARQAILDVDGTITIVASIKAHGTGRNLQVYHRAIVAGGSSGGEMWEQLLGRLHRTGQTRDVRYDVLFPYELESARRDNSFKLQTTGAPQKLLTCDYVCEGRTS